MYVRWLVIFHCIILDLVLTHARICLERARSVFGVCRKVEKKNENCSAHAQTRHGADRVPGADRALSDR